MAVEYHCCETGFFIRIIIVAGLVLFAGLMSGLTMGLMSLSLVDLEVLAKSGTPSDRKHATKILPVVKRQHLLLCTLLICNAAAMEALPVFLDTLIVPQAVCTRYGLAIGAKVAPLVQILVWICFPVAYPISKLLDLVLGKGHEALFRRAELKTLVDLHGNEAGKGGELTRDETTIIAGALELSEKTAMDAMTPISETFAININAKLDRDLMKLILEKGHSRVPVYHECLENIIGLILVKNLLTINPADEVPVKNITIRRIPRVPETMPLYDILNEFQKGHSHMAVVIKQNNKTEQTTSENLDRDVRVDIDCEKHHPRGRCLPTKRKLKKWKDLDGNLERASSKSKKWARDFHSEILQINDDSLPLTTGDGEAIGIITLEDVIEELLQEEIFDETDHRHES
ncbi:Cystathionine beta-synthase, core [Corchorus olitorius]|uniref:Cystathionine beta-synthase, core n=1 Tax=Corchorus olitorius TaxID=93759 RepID=A0A1R3K451_9ROSI|nr:Cystathionine beta-synthase, core [Corchorus olitorius]